MFAAVFKRRADCGGGLGTGGRYPDGQAGCAISVPPVAGSPYGSCVPGDRVAWQTLRRRHAVVQTKVGAKDIYGCRRHSGVDHPAAWCAVCRPLDYLNEKMQNK